MRGKSFVWDVTVTVTYAASDIVETAECTGAAVTIAAENKINKYSCIRSTHHFVPIAIEIGAYINIEAQIPI